ncbi:hypothetical protein HX878_20750 [Pseudomonas veronii]|uniref:hypothetical protein n=1 Tax=Pseudomonas veronii TaxID=76761 RepID=UPI0015A193CF|nr:hypothetical protein [Pseudomonas veronii]NWD57164.1 hypothetical protein [Pseudomonas veronii]
MAIESNGVGAWPKAWQEIGAVPYQLIITMPEYTWVAVAQLACLFLAVIALVVFVLRKKVGFGWGAFAGLIVAFVVCIPMFMSIDFGPKRLEPVAPLERPELLYMTAEAKEQLLAAMCEAEVFPSDMLEVCAELNPTKKCSTVGRHMSACKPVN